MKMLNKQKYTECQLVTAINAAIFLGQPPVDPESEEYERLVDLVCARTGAALRITKAIEYLRIKRAKIPNRFPSFRKALREGNPVELGVWHKKTGFHSVLLTAIEPKGKDYTCTVLNFPQVTKRRKIKWSELRKCMVTKGTFVDGETFKFFLNPIYKTLTDEEEALENDQSD